MPGGSKRHDKLKQICRRNGQTIVAKMQRILSKKDPSVIQEKHCPPKHNDFIFEEQGGVYYQSLSVNKPDLAVFYMFGVCESMDFKLTFLKVTKC